MKLMHVLTSSAFRNPSQIISAVKTINKMYKERVIDYSEFKRRKEYVLSAVEFSHVAVISNLFVV